MAAFNDWNIVNNQVFVDFGKNMVTQLSTFGLTEWNIPVSSSTGPIWFTDQTSATSDNFYHNYEVVKVLAPQISPHDTINQALRSLGYGARLDLPKQRLQLAFPDGSILFLDENGNFRINDRNAKVTYKANRNLEFNPYVNASELVSRFIEFVGQLGLTREQMKIIPLEMFVQWLVIEAAAKDGLPTPRGYSRKRLRRSCVQIGRVAQGSVAPGS